MQGLPTTSVKERKIVTSKRLRLKDRESIYADCVCVVCVAYLIHLCCADHLSTQGENQKLTKSSYDIYNKCTATPIKAKQTTQKNPSNLDEKKYSGTL